MASFIRHQKRIDIMHFRGEELHAYVNRRILSIEHKDHIVEQLLHKLADLHHQGFVLCDIKSSNICIDQHHEAHYIDDTAAIQRGQSVSGLTGTVGYYAPEFFINPHAADFFAFLDWQEKIYGQKTLLSELKPRPELYQQFSQASDVYALGCVLLRDLGLDEYARFYPLAWQMCADDITQRPNLTELYLIQPG